MDRQLARHVVISAFHSMSYLTDLLPILKAHCDPQEFEIFRNAIASVAGNISIDIIGKVFTAHPDLEQEIEENVKKYGVPS